MEAWRDYQERAADFFRTLGFPAAVDQVLQGARARHQIDVVVSPRQLGLSRLWVVECKAWSRPVSKDRLLAFQQVVVDVGADRGFLLSESGHQVGAHSAATSTNLTLASIAELRQLAISDIEAATVHSPYVASYHEHHDFGMGAETDLYLRRRDGLPLELPLSCELIASPTERWLHEVASSDLEDGGHTAHLSRWSFGDGAPAGRTYQVIWRTPHGPVLAHASIDIEK